MTPICASPGTRLAADVLPWLGALILAVLVGVGAIHLVRRWLKRQDDPPGDFTLQQLRDLHAAGNLTDEEFERAKSAVIGRLTEHGHEGEKIGPPPEEQ